MRIKGNKFGVFKGVFTPSILTILGVIMYLRLPWIVGQAGLLATLGIIFVAHIISATTGLSVSSIATDKKVETGGTYFIIYDSHIHQHQPRIKDPIHHSGGDDALAGFCFYW